MEQNKEVMGPDDGSHLDAQAVVRFLYKEKWLILAVTLALGTAGTTWILRMPKVFEAKATLEYDPNPPRPLRGDVEDVADPVGNYWASREFFETQNEILKSRTVCERVVEKLGLRRDPTFMLVPKDQRATWRGATKEEAAALLASLLRVEQHAESRIVDVRYSDVNPTRAQLVVNAVVEAFIQKTLNDRLGATADALDWMSAQLYKLKGELDTSELALHEFKQSHNISSLSLEDSQNVVAGQIQRYNEALTDARTQRIELSTRLAQLESLLGQDLLGAHAPAIDGDPNVQAIRRELTAVTVRREGMAVRYGPNHAEIKTLDAQLVMLKSQLDREIQGLVAGARRELQAAADAERQIQGALNEANQAGISLNLREIEYSRLSRAKVNNEKLYSVLLERTTEANLTKLLRVSHARLIDQALQPEVPVSPKVMVLVPLCLVASLFLGVLAGFIHSILDRSIRSVEAVERLGVTILGMLPDFGSSAPTQPRRRNAAPQGSRPDLIVHTHPHSSVAESCRTLRTNLAFMEADRSLRTILLTSASPQEGKTTVASSLAISIAQSGKRVLLIDTDLRRPRVHRAFGLSNTQGVTSIVVNHSNLEETVCASGVPNVDILACGPIPPNPAELLHTARFRDLIAEASSKYDTVIFDSPPLNAVADAAIIAPQVEGVILVGRARRTTRDAMAAALRQLRAVSAKILGVVLNDVNMADRRYAYGNYYYYYSGDYYAMDADEKTAASN